MDMSVITGYSWNWLNRFNFSNVDFSGSMVANFNHVLGRPFEFYSVARLNEYSDAGYRNIPDNNNCRQLA